MTNNQRLIAKILILIATMIPIELPFAPSAQAEIPPGSYDKLRINAEEALIIKVVTVDRRLTGNREFTLVSVTAQVVAVQRSKTGLKPGKEISIQYEFQHPHSRMPGPPRIAVLQAGEYYPAFLNISEDQKTYSPAAYEKSFNMIPEN